MGVVWGHPRSSEMSPFDRAHTTSYLSSIETMRLSCTVFEIRRLICGNSPTLPYPTSIWRPHWVDPIRISKRFLASENQNPWAIVRLCLRDRICSRFDTIPACDRRTHRQTDGHTTTANTALAQRRAVKTAHSLPNVV